ncbi:hypothetical protein [Glycomyces sp. YM15]|uniref:hypothetical protein n=1 Tax=Glycomyces sp. YM15 TaxID=2800446 RepID=UPI001966B305|nr:hypothetical protein [Glycomyces sp. YM15]
MRTTTMHTDMDMDKSATEPNSAADRSRATDHSAAAASRRTRPARPEATTSPGPHHQRHPADATTATSSTSATGVVSDTSAPPGTRIRPEPLSRRAPQLLPGSRVRPQRRQRTRIPPLQSLIALTATDSQPARRHHAHDLILTAPSLTA